MWQCEDDPTIGTTESRLLEAVEPLWKTHSAPNSGWKILPRASQQRIESHLHHMIKSALKSPLSWWQIAPLFSLPLSVYNLRYVFMVCNRLLKTHTHHWIPQKFILRHSPTLCVLACANQNWKAAESYRAFVPNNLTRVKVINALCQLNVHSGDLDNIVERLIQEHPLENSCYPFFTNCLKNNSQLSNVVATQMKISSFDWRCALQMVGEDWNDDERALGLDSFCVAVKNQIQKYGCEAFVAALNDEIVSLKYRCNQLPLGWLCLFNAAGEDWNLIREYYSFKVATPFVGKNCSMFSTLALHSDDAVLEGVLRFVQPLYPTTHLFVRLMENHLFAAAEKLLKIASVDDTYICSDLQNIEAFPYLQSWLLKQTISSSIPSGVQHRIRKL